MRGISSEQPNYIEELNNSYGFLSYDSVLNYDDEFLDLPPLDFNNSADFIIDDPYLAAVLNHNREISVGNLICRVENEYVFVYVDGYFNETSEFKNSGKTIEYNTAEVINDKLIAYKPQIDGEYQVKAWVAGYGFRNNHNNDYFASNSRRMKSTHWQTNVFFHKSAGMKTVNYKKKKRKDKWKKTKADEIRVWGEVSVEITPSGAPTVTQSYKYDVDKTNKKKAVHTIFTYTGIGISVDGNSITGISGAPGSSVKILSSTYSNHYDKDAGSFKTRNNKTWPW